MFLSVHLNQTARTITIELIEQNVEKCIETPLKNANLLAVLKQIHANNQPRIACELPI